MKPFLIGTLVLGLAAGCAEAFPEPTQVDSKARGLLDEVAKAYKALPSYSDQGQFALTMTIDGKEQKQSMPLSLTFVRPNRLDLKTDPVRVVSDGKTMTTTVAPLKKFMAAPAPGAITPDTFREGPIGAVLFGGSAGPPMHILVNLLVADDPVEGNPQAGGDLEGRGRPRGGGHHVPGAPDRPGARGPTTACSSTRRPSS